LPAGPLPGTATADDRVSNLISEILGPRDDRSAPSIGQDAPSDDAMSYISERQNKRKIRETLSDSDMGGRVTKGRKTLRSRVIGSDSDDEPIAISDSSGGAPQRLVERELLDFLLRIVRRTLMILLNS